MTERIDHVGEARALLAAADSDVSRNHPLNTGEDKADLLANAKVHATLALVEQQRIANLIQLMHVPVGELNDEIRSALHASFHSGPENWQEALGL